MRPFLSSILSLSLTHTIMHLTITFKNNTPAVCCINEDGARAKQNKQMLLSQVATETRGKMGKLKDKRLVPNIIKQCLDPEDVVLPLKP